MQLTKMAINRDRNTIQSQLLGPFQRNSEKPLECINITGCLNFIQNRVFSISLNIGQTIFYVSSVLFLTTVYIIKIIKDQLTSQQILRCVLNQIFTIEGFVMYALFIHSRCFSKLCQKGSTSCRWLVLMSYTVEIY